MNKDKKTFLISVAKYFHKNATHEELRKTKLTVTCKDWIDAVIERNKVFKIIMKLRVTVLLVMVEYQ